MGKRISIGIFAFGLFTMGILLYLPRHSSYKVISQKEHDEIVKVLKSDAKISRDLEMRLKCKISGYEKL